MIKFTGLIYVPTKMCGSNLQFSYNWWDCIRAARCLDHRMTMAECRSAGWYPNRVRPLQTNELHRTWVPSLHWWRCHSDGQRIEWISWQSSFRTVTIRWPRCEPSGYPDRLSEMPLYLCPSTWIVPNRAFEDPAEWKIDSSNNQFRNRNPHKFTNEVIK